MSRPSSIDKLPEKLREEIGRLRAEGFSIDEILAALGQLSDAAISRSALGRHIKGMEAAGRKLRQAREVSLALTQQLGDAPASRTAQLNIEFLHSAVTDVFMAEDGGGGLDPKSIEVLSKALDHLTRARKSDLEFVKQIEARTEARVVKEAAQRVEAVARERGISAETIAAIRAGVIGAPASKPAGGTP